MPSSCLDLSALTPAAASPRGRPSAQRAHQLRQHIIDVASGLMLEHGYEATTLDAIASVAGITKRTIYTRFGSKELLLREVLLRSARPSWLAFALPRAHTGRRERLIALAQGLHQSWMGPEMQRWMRLVANEFTPRPDMRHLLQQASNEFLELMEQTLRAELGAVIDAVSARMFTATIAAPAQNHALFGLDAGSPEQQARYMERAVDQLLLGATAHKGAHEAR